MGAGATVTGYNCCYRESNLIFLMITSNWYKLYFDFTLYSTLLAKNDSVATFLLQYTKLHTVTPPYPQYVAYQIGQSVTTNIKSVATNDT